MKTDWTNITRNSGLSIVGVLTVCAILFPWTNVFADDPFANIKKYLIRIHVSGESDKGKAIDNWGSGVFVGTGQILTAYHVIFEDRDGETVTYKPYPEQPNPRIELWGVDENDRLTPIVSSVEIESDYSADSDDVIRLQISGKNIFAPCSTDEITEGVQLRALGWLRDHDTFDPLGPGTLVNFDAASDEGRRKISGMTANFGDSGGPVFDGEGVVVGVLTGGRNKRIDPGTAYVLFKPLSDLAQLSPPLRKCQGRKAVLLSGGTSPVSGDATSVQSKFGEQRTLDEMPVAQAHWGGDDAWDKEFVYEAPPGWLILSFRTSVKSKYGDSWFNTKLVSRDATFASGTTLREALDKLEKFAKQRDDNQATKEIEVFRSRLPSFSPVLSSSSNALHIQWGGRSRTRRVAGIVVDTVTASLNLWVQITLARSLSPGDLDSLVDALEQKIKNGQDINLAAYLAE
jgi:hypothetical protein